MSRQKKFKVKIATLDFSAYISKSRGEQMPMCQTYTSDGLTHQVRTVKVVTVDDAKPTELSDILKIIPWNDVQSAYPYVDEETGENKLLPLDDKDVCKIFEKSDYMQGMGFVRAHQITPNMFSGDHYYLCPSADSKTKKVSLSDQQAYTILLTALSDGAHMYVTTFVSGDREKYAAIYVANDALMISVLIHSTYQRDPPAIPKLAIPNVHEYGKKLIAKCPYDFVAGNLEDLYEKRLGEHIEELKRLAQERAQAPGEVPMAEQGTKIKARLRPAVKADDFLSKLDSLF